MDFSHHHHHHHDHDQAGPAVAVPWRRLRLALRFGVAALILAGAALATCSVVVSAGEAVVINRFGDPVRVLSQPGLNWKLPAPIDSIIPVDLRLRTTSSGLQDVGTRDGLRILLQAYVAWQVPDDPDAIRRFLRAVRNDPDEAARQLRSLEGAALQITASSFALDELVNTDPARVHLTEFEARLATQLTQQSLSIYGVAVRQVGIERLSLPAETLAATVERMRAERETVAAQRTAAGLRAASAIRSDAARDARITVAQAQEAAAQIEAQSRAQAAAIFGQAYQADPQLYTLLRSLDTIGGVVGSNTRIILRTDAAPFRALVDGPPK